MPEPASAAADVGPFRSHTRSHTAPQWPSHASSPACSRGSCHVLVCSRWAGLPCTSRVRRPGPRSAPPRRDRCRVSPLHLASNRQRASVAAQKGQKAVPLPRAAPLRDGFRVPCPQLIPVSAADPHPSLHAACFTLKLLSAAKTRTDSDIYYNTGYPSLPI